MSSDKKKNKKEKNENKEDDEIEKIGLDSNLSCIKIQVNSYRSEFLYYQRYPKKNNTQYDPKFCALVYYFNENLNDHFFYLYFSLMGQIDDIAFGSFFGHNKNKKKNNNEPKLIHFAIVKYVEEESLNILLDFKKAQKLINDYLEKTRNYKLDLKYDPLKEFEEENLENEDDKKNKEDDFVLVTSNTAKNNFSLNGVSFKIAKEKNKVDLELEEDDENSDMPNFKKKKKKKNKGNDFYWNYQLLDKKRNVRDELAELFKKDKEVIERKQKIKK